MSTGLVHDYLLVMRGAERTFAAMADCWPSSDVYTLLYDPHGTHYKFARHNVTASYLQYLGLRQHNFRRALPLFPRAAESLPVQDHDVVVSSSSAFAHGIRVAPGAVHVCYCHSPFRYIWHERERGLTEVPKAVRPVLTRALDRVRDWDRRAAGAVTRYIANSEVTRARIREFYGRDCALIHPPVDVDRFELGEPEDYALVVTEIVRHKRVDLTLEAARRAGQRVKVVGTGPELADLQQRFADTAEFLGRVPDGQLDRLYANARMFIMSNVEEFGIAAVEAQAAGRPVIAAAAGGALETVVDGKTGVLVEPGDVEALAEAIRYTDFESFSPDFAQLNARRFSVDSFKERLREEVATAAGTFTAVETPVPVAA